MSTMQLIIALVILAMLAGAANAATSRYSKQVQRACANDYHQHCGEYGIETAALRVCMNKAGKALSKPCVNALVASGEVSRAEVERRKKALLTATRECCGTKVTMHSFLRLGPRREERSASFRIRIEI